MTAMSGEERAAMREGFARLLAAKGGEADVRRTMTTDTGHDPALWQAMAEMGILGLLVPEEHGGIGAGAAEIEAIMEEAGAALLAGPLMSSAVLAAGLLAGADEDVRARLLPAIATGERIAAVAITGEAGCWTTDGLSVKAGPGGRLDGVASFVLSANVADVLLVIARGPDGIGCFEITPDAPGVRIEPLESWDRTLRLSRISFAGAEARPIVGIGESAVEHMLDLARIALAGEQAGAARRIFDITIEYLQTRIQFGRPIGSFQALKHMAADLLVEVESATSAARAAAQAFDADAADREALVSLAAFACADAFSEVAAASIQMHGGIAFTWEHVAHLYLRRARADAQLFGQSDAYRERYLGALEKAA